MPKEARDVLFTKSRFDVARIDAIEKEVGHDVIAFVSAVAENVGPEGRFLHYGLTSSDVADTALLHDDDATRSTCFSPISTPARGG